MDLDSALCLEGTTGLVPASTCHFGASEKRPPSTFRTCCTCLVEAIGSIRISSAGLDAERESMVMVMTLTPEGRRTEAVAPLREVPSSLLVG
mmetsp:Transcript_13/g.24  ORF Transcript_13/g.24 Transcript_13/m.24 type:complete len:92 (+) Transcript_13:573-848(+)